MLDSFWPIEDTVVITEVREESTMALKLHLSMNFGPQYQPTKVEAEGTPEELAEWLGTDAKPFSIIGKWSEGHAYATENLSPKG